jgi:hypothetical protein
VIYIDCESFEIFSRSFDSFKYSNDYFPSNTLLSVTKMSSKKKSQWKKIARVKQQMRGRAATINTFCHSRRNVIISWHRIFPSDLLIAYFSSPIIL